MEFSDGLEERFRAIRETLQDLRAGLREVRDKVETTEQWKSRTGQVIDGMIERIDSAVDDLDNVKKEQQHHRDFISSFKGGKTAVIQTITLAVAALGSLATLLKLTIFK